MHIRSIHIETESHTAFKILRRKDEVEKKVQHTLLMDIQVLLREMDECRIGFTYREANRVAEKLAMQVDHGKTNPFVYQTFDDSPRFILNELLFDYSRKRDTRSVGLNCMDTFFYINLMLAFWKKKNNIHV